MARGKILAGIDVGSSFARAIIAEDVSEQEPIRIIGVGCSPSFGIRKGVVVDIEEVSKAINGALEAAERMAGVAVENAVVSIGGSQLTIQNSKGVVAIGRADGEVARDDIDRAIEAAQAVSIPVNQEIVHIIPKSYRLDDQSGIKDPLGMHGVRLEVDAIIIEAPTSHVKNLSKCVFQAGVEIEEMILSPLAAAKSVLNKKQKELGGVLINVGGGTTSIAVYEEGDLVHTAIVPVGSSHITNDIAIGLRTSIELAEKVKLEFGSASTKDIDPKEEIDLSQLNSHEEGTVSLFHIAEIIEARLEEIFFMVNKELKAIGKAGLLPAGAILTGGGAKMPGLVEFTKEVLGLPAQLGFPIQLGGVLDKVDDPEYATAVGLVLWSRENHLGHGVVHTGAGVMNNFSKKCWRYDSQSQEMGGQVFAVKTKIETQTIYNMAVPVRNYCS